MTEQEFRGLAAQGFNRIPVVLETLADLDTPLSIYLKLGNAAGTYLLESVVGGERFGRYSFVGLACEEMVTVSGNRFMVRKGSHVAVNEETSDPLTRIDEYLAQIKAAPLPGDLRFSGGLVGYFTYDTVRYIEPKLNTEKTRAKPDPLKLPEIRLMRSEEIAIVDNLSSKLYLVVYADPAKPNALELAHERLSVLRAKLRDHAHLPRYRPAGGTHEVVSNLGLEVFTQAVQKCKQYIVDGDIMQVQISQRLSQRFDAPPINLYRALRSINPSPYMYFLDFDDCQIVGASPEILVRQEKGQGKTPGTSKVTVRPIAGTRKRGATQQRDKELEHELTTSEKERAEHLMLIDLGRNDIGRICKIGSVRVTDTFTVERYSHVMHMVSNVEGDIDEAMSPMDVLRATFPAGTVTGAPKVRAMEIIDELEPMKRAIYAGAVGYIGYNGNMDLAIAIRTGVIKDGYLHVQAAAGVVADSRADHEWLETQNKARALLKAAEMVQGGIDINLAGV
jgi:anthranilate synthase component I